MAAYDAIAPYYDSLLEARKHYLKKVEEIVIACSRSAHSLLDVGSGNGVRALRIARAIKTEDVVLVEPSEQMRLCSPEKAVVWKRSVSEIPETARFDLITCLWNVLGHLEDTQERLLLLSRLKALLGPSGMLFLDVNHRYNALSYGWSWTISRVVRDLVFPSRKNGDVIASWQAGHQRICTRGHVFTHREMVHLFKCAGFRLRAGWVIDYKTGVEHSFSFFGNLLYQLAV